MITDATHHCINLKSRVVHAMSHSAFTLCGRYTGIRNKTISLGKTDKKVTCKRCLKYIDQCFRDWDKDQDRHPSIVDTFDEEIHSSQITAQHVFD